MEDNQNDHLMDLVTKEELKEVVYSFQREKSPSPNGWPIIFYVGFYECIKYDLLVVVEESRTFGKVVGAFNSTFLSLIPKKDDPDTFEDFRPISLCNSIYKIIAKV